MEKLQGVTATAVPWVSHGAGQAVPCQVWYVMFPLSLPAPRKATEATATISGRTCSFLTKQPRLHGS